MRSFILIGLGAAALALAAPASAHPHAKSRPQARAAEEAATPASYRSEAGHGYSARDRRMLDCLASNPRYDPAVDRVLVRPGVTRPCQIRNDG